MPARPPRSTLFIGGAEDKVGRATLLRRFTKLAGGRKAHIVVIPTASSFRSEVVEAYTTVFTRFGASRISVVDPRPATRPTWSRRSAALDTATGVFERRQSTRAQSDVREHRPRRPFTGPTPVVP